MFFKNSTRNVMEALETVLMDVQRVRLTKSKGKNIVKVLKEKHGISEFTPQFKHWIKQRGFKLIH